uniref:Uncharacterized protein n=1 Tax=Arundo donax TaxID=35708 RepID=A0A0A9GX86_ARUDO
MYLQNHSFCCFDTGQTHNTLAVQTRMKNKIFQQENITFWGLHV